MTDSAIPEMVDVTINGRWTLMLPEHRAARQEWPVWEQERIASMHSVLQPGMVVYDLGSEEGDLPALWATWVAGKEGGVVLVEPNPRVWPNIRAIWQANNLAPPLGWFVGFASDVLDENPPNLNIDATVMEDGWPACAHGPIISDHGFRHLAQEFDATPRIPLDVLSKRIGGRVDAITMDVEGAEWHVLHGARQVLKEQAPHVWVSVHPEVMAELYHRLPEDVNDLMKAYGYRAELLAIDHEEHWYFRPPGRAR